jgi:N-acetylneuraminic acid mutarotase
MAEHRKCPKCGKEWELAGEVKFCPFCGASCYYSEQKTLTVSVPGVDPEIFTKEEIVEKMKEIKENADKGGGYEHKPVMCYSSPPGW